VIFFCDFELNDVFGPLLVVREPRTSDGDLGIRKDAIDNQETRQEQRPARMVGTLQSIEKSNSDLVIETGMEAGRDLRTDKAALLTRRGES